MGITSYGYGEQQLNEAEWARLAAMTGSPYGHSTATAGEPRKVGPWTVGFGDGSIAGYGVLDDLVAVTYDLPQQSGWWSVCARREWGAGKRETTIAHHQIAAGSRVAPARNRRPGTIDDQPLGVVETNAGGIAAISDARLLAAKNFAVSDVSVVDVPEVGAVYRDDQRREWLAERDAGRVVLRRINAVSDPFAGLQRPPRWGIASPVTFDSRGAFIVRHNLGYRPTFFTFDWEMNETAHPLVIRFALDGITDTTVRVLAKFTRDNTPYTGNLARLFWVAYGGV